MAVEGMAKGCMVLLANDEGLIDVITPKNIEKYNYDNFLGLTYESIGSENIKNKLLSFFFDRTRLSEILEGNFKYIFVTRSTDIIIFINSTKLYC